MTKDKKNKFYNKIFTDNNKKKFKDNKIIDDNDVIDISENTYKSDLMWQNVKNLSN